MILVATCPKCGYKKTAGKGLEFCPSDGSSLRTVPETDNAPHRPPVSIEKIVRRLLEFGKSIPPRVLLETEVPEARELLERDHFAFALAAVLDRGAKAEKIWTIPYYLRQALDGLDPRRLAEMTDDELYGILARLPAKPRYITDAPRTIRELSRIVVDEYGGDVKLIWKGRSSSQVYSTFRAIFGVGPGIASMMVLLLERCFGVSFNESDHRNTDVKPDVHVIRVFRRLGLITQVNSLAARDAARRYNPDYPGALDAPTWRIGKTWCHPKEPDCVQCPMDDLCQAKPGPIDGQQILL